MKIAFLNISQSLVQRGAETFVRELSTRLAQDHQVTVVSGHKIPPGRWPIIWRFFIDGHGLYILWFTLSKIPLLWKEKFDVVVPLNGGWQSLLVRVLTLLYGGKMIISGQSGKGWDDRVNLWFFPSRFVALSSSLSKWAKRINPFTEVSYIPNGVDLVRFTPEGAKAKVSLNGPIFLCVGALTHEKRIDLAIRAVYKLAKGSLLVIGQGKDEKQLSLLGQQLLGNRFKIVSADFEQMPNWYRAAHIFTLPSPSYRAFEIVLVEAMACNLPVVVNDDPIRREIVQEAGLFVNPDKIEAYAKALDQALARSWYNKPRIQAEKFSWDKITQQYLQLFQDQ
ncbi:glycosyltransferase family 4 protein [Candidatus Daviesbacteria bacterium]|nr:glycosyltransferase family 4 protein [Candidatus Daviesbacteria bacterium]